MRADQCDRRPRGTSRTMTKAVRDVRRDAQTQQPPGQRRNLYRPPRRVDITIELA
ncbi:MAG TPA: hypothetical protein VFE59_28160 [Trebonia sp.]|nr:hypothetical protein [Trebonia sp.]